MKLLRTGLAALLLSLSAGALAGAAEDFAALLDEHWEWRLASSPMMASMIGDRRFNDQWQDDSLAGIERRHEQRREFLRRVYAIERTALSVEDQLNYELFRRQLQDDVDEHKFNAHLMPFFHRGGVQNLENVTSQLRLTSTQDFEDWLARIAKVDRVIEQTIELAEAGRKAGLVPPKVLMQRLVPQLELQVVDAPEDSPFYRVFASLPESVPAKDRARLQRAAEQKHPENRAARVQETQPLLQRYLSAGGACQRRALGVSPMATPGTNSWHDPSRQRA